MPTIKEIQELMILAEKYNLEHRDILQMYSISELTHIFNGIGPDRMPKWMREALGFLHPSLVVVALIHDVEFHVGGNEFEFKASNRRFRINGHKVAKQKYSWWNPLRYIVMRKASRFAAYCQLFGCEGWRKK